MKKRKLTILFSVMLVICFALLGCSREIDREWQPDRERPWNFTPTIRYRDLDDYDIEVTLDSSTYPADVEQIGVYVYNKTGQTFILEASGLFVEKYDQSAFPAMESIGGWVRLPYYTGYMMYQKTESARADVPFIFYTEYLQENCKLTPGQYRFVVFLGDGPHYAYFEITG